MLTRSFIQSYLLVTESAGLAVQEEGLKLINEKKYIKVIEPTQEEKTQIHAKLVTVRKDESISYKEFLNNIFKELNITKGRKRLEEALNTTEIDKFDRDKTIEFINRVKEFYIK